VALPAAASSPRPRSGPKWPGSDYCGLGGGAQSDRTQQGKKSVTGRGAAAARRGGPREERGQGRELTRGNGQRPGRAPEPGAPDPAPAPAAGKGATGREWTGGGAGGAGATQGEGANAAGRGPGARGHYRGGIASEWPPPHGSRS
jgi:hypothetical protein